MNLTKHQYAIRFLAILSFIESIFLPIPPDVMLVPMSIAQPKFVWKYAFIATLFSVLGGIVGYYLGFICANLMLQLIYKFGYQQEFLNCQQIFTKWGLIAVILAGITPIPYKIFTIGSGLFKFNLVGFILGSIIGRGLRFFLVSGLFKLYGSKVDLLLRNFLYRYSKIFIIIMILLIASYFFSIYLS